MKQILSWVLIAVFILSCCGCSKNDGSTAAANASGKASSAFPDASDSSSLPDGLDSDGTSSAFETGNGSDSLPSVESRGQSEREAGKNHSEHSPITSANNTENSNPVLKKASDNGVDENQYALHPVSFPNPDQEIPKITSDEETLYQKLLQDFSFQTAADVLQSQQGNVVYSPYSLYSALAVLTTVTGGNTRAQLCQFHGLPGKGSDDVLRWAFWLKQNAPGESANSIWLRYDARYREPYLNRMAAPLAYDCFLANFTDQEDMNGIGHWVSQKTNGLIRYQPIPDPMLQLMLINTLYFKDAWVDRFTTVEKRDFFVAPDQKMECDSMIGKRTTAYWTGKGFAAASLPMENGTVTFVLPDEGGSVEALLAGEGLSAILARKDARYIPVFFEIPKFSIRSHHDDLHKLIARMGMPDLMGSGADFSELTDSPIDAQTMRIEQELYFAMDEVGVEGAAMTTIPVAGCAPPDEETAEMHLNRPFLFVVSGPSGTISFAGVCRNPLVS